MVEPLATAVFNSIVSGCSLMRCTPSLQSVARAVVATPRSHVSPDFFTPRPRQAKGKEKAVDSLDSVLHLSQCQEWSVCSHSHSSWCLDKARRIMLEETALTHASSSRRYPTRRQAPRSSLLSPSAYVSQRRYASCPPEPLKPDSYDDSSSASSSHMTLDSKSLAIQRFQLINSLPLRRFQPEPAWDAYLTAQACSALESLSVPEILVFAEKLADAVEEQYRVAGEPLESMHEWGQRIRTVLDAADLRALGSNDIWGSCLTVRALALIGDIDTATQQWLSLEGRTDGLGTTNLTKLPDAIKSLVLSVQNRSGAAKVLDFVAQHIRVLHARLGVGVELDKRGQSLRDITYRIISQIEDPVQFMMAREDMPRGHKRVLAVLLMDALCSNNLGAIALNVYEEMGRQMVSCPTAIILTVVRALAREGMLEAAQLLYDNRPRTVRFKYQVSTGLYVAAYRAEVETAERRFQILLQNGWADENELAMLFYAYATAGQMDALVKRFADFFPEDQSERDEKTKSKPTRTHFGIVMHGYSLLGDQESISLWLDKLFQAGLTPDLPVYGSILKCYAVRGDLDAMTGLVNQMRGTGVKLNHVLYTTLISYFADRGDAVAADATYKRALEEGIVPDRIMSAALMNAFAEAGEWRKVVGMFESRQPTPGHLTPPNIHTFNILLKAYVLIGAPFPIVRRLFQKLPELKLKPSTHSYALLIQSACDAQQMDVAMRIFSRMDTLAQRDRSQPAVDIYILTIILAGFLRCGKYRKARAIWREISRRGLTPNIVTWAAYVKAFADEATEQSLRIAERWVASLVKDDLITKAPNFPDVPPRHSSALEYIYGPLLKAYATSKQPERVEQTFQAMVNAGGVPSLGTLTTLLNAYRLQKNVEGVLELWPQIFELGLDYARNRDQILKPFPPDETRARLESNILCLPFSYYIDAVSTAGLHENVVEAWRAMQAHGFSFDAHNWNYLIAALVRAGESERAFEVGEKVIVPSRDRRRAPPPKQLKTMVSAGMPLRRNPLRTLASDLNMQNTELAATPEPPDDLTNPLLLLDISPAWNPWDFHKYVLKVLALALQNLEQGYVLLPIGPDSMAEATKSDPPAAHSSLQNIFTKCPRTVATVREFMRRAQEEYYHYDHLRQETG